MFNKGLKAIVHIVFLFIACLPHTASAASADDSFLTRNIRISVKVTNSGWQNASGIKVSLPLVSANSSYQQTLKETFNQKVIEIENGAAGSRTAHIVIDSIAPGQSETIAVDYLLQIKPGGGLCAGTVKDLDSFLKPSHKIESNQQEIVTLAKKLTGSIPNEITKINQIGAFIDSHMKYKLDSAYKNQGALSALRNGEGVCGDYAALFVALSRAAGIPARQVNGFSDPAFTGVSWRSRSTEVSLQGFRHSWGEVYIQDLGWVAVDPTFKIYPQEDKNAVVKLSPSHIAQNYDDQPVKIRYQGEKLAVDWGNLLINPQ